MYIFSAVLPAPGIEAWMPMTSGCLAVSQTLTVAHSSGFLSIVGPVAAGADAAEVARAVASAKAVKVRTRGAYRRVMDRLLARSVGVGTVMELSTSEPTTARFDA